MQADQAAVLGAVSEGGDHAITGGFLLGTALGVVADGRHQRLAVALPGQVQVHLAQLAAGGVVEQLPVALGVGLLDHLGHGIEAGVAGCTWGGLATLRPRCGYPALCR